MEEERKREGKAAKIVRKYVLMTISSFLYAIAVSLILEPVRLTTGGVTGIAIILNYFTGIGTGTWFLLLNVPILAAGVWKFGKSFIFPSLYGTVVISFFTNFLSDFELLTLGLGNGTPIIQDTLLAALAGGTLLAVGMGGVFKAGGTTGGVDIIVKMLREKFPYKKTGSLFLMMDIIVVSLSALAFRDLERALYAAITIFCSTNILDLVLYGRDGAKLVYIISDHAEKIKKRLLEELEIGVTCLSGKGAFSGREKTILFCVMKKRTYPQAEEIVKTEDESAFLIVSDAQEIYGEGYKSFFEKKL